MCKTRVLLAVLSALALAAGPAAAKTQMTGDVIDGKPVIAKLDVASLEGGKVHKFFFAAGDMNVGQRWYVPLMVAKGAEKGPGLLLNAAIHGDELNGVAVIQRLFEELDPATLRGAVIALPGINTSGMLLHSRLYHYSADGGSATNLNRLMPGDASSSNPGERYTNRLWTQVYEGNVDAAIDMHTQSRGTDYPLYVFADYRNPKIKRLAEALQPDMVKIDTGLEGTVEYAFVEAGIPAVTFEIGAPKVYEWDHIDRAKRGIRNVMVDMKMLDGEIEDLGVETFVGNYFETLSAEVGGFTEVLVELKQPVTKGQRVALQRNAFGEIVAEYHAPFDARVLSLATDPLREPGATVVRFLHMSDKEGCEHGCRPGY
ncbi:MAG: succinylglutamate desuccinylase/aspartoacylase family protein [Kiloniellales bacterium]|nr:succinylglutamate desuccinylase/aspartoacylase family protein [Kiloniellales bacterium]